MSLIADGASQFEHHIDIIDGQECPFTQAHKRVVVQQNMEQKRFFILAEFPETEDEASKGIFDSESSTGVILNLIEKLGIRQAAHFSFALKSVPPKELPDDHVSCCMFETLKEELNRVSPEVIFCFGMRAFSALERLDVSTKIYLLPTALELKHYPQWRLPVWSKLVHFKQKKHIDS